MARKSRAPLGANQLLEREAAALLGWPYSRLRQRRLRGDPVPTYELVGDDDLIAYKRSDVLLFQREHPEQFGREPTVTVQQL